MTDRTSRLLARALSATGLVLAGYYLTLGGEYSVFDLRELRALRGQAAARVDSLRAEVDRLSVRSDSLETVPHAIERIAREEHGFIRDGEQLYMFVDVEGDTP